MPVNFDAIAMTEGEKYTTDVFRKRKAEVDGIFKKQNRISEVTAFVNPLQAVQYSSMALCGTDYNHYMDFQNQAESYRLYFVNVMNDFMSTHTRTGDWDTQFGRDVYKLITPFQQKQLPLNTAMAQQPLPFIALLSWLIISFFLVFTTNLIKLQ